MADKDLKIRVTADTQQFASQLEGIRNSISSIAAGGSLGSAAGSLIPGAGALVAAGAVVVGVLGRLTSSITDLGRKAGEVLDTATRLGVRPEIASGLSKAATKLGVEPGQLQGTLERLAVSQGLAQRGDKGALRALKAIGLSDEDILSNNSLATAIQLSQFLQGAGTGGASQAIVRKLAGSSGLSIIGALANQDFGTILQGSANAREDEETLKAKQALGIKMRGWISERLANFARGAEKIAYDLTLGNFLDVTDDPFIQEDARASFQRALARSPALKKKFAAAQTKEERARIKAEALKALELDQPSEIEPPALSFEKLGFRKSQNDLQSIGLFAGGRGSDSFSVIREQLNVLRQQLQEQKQINANWQTSFGQ